MPLRHCRNPNCPELIRHEGYCAKHATSAPAVAEAALYAFYRSADWLRLRNIKLAKNPVCQWHQCTAFAQDVHHLEPVRTAWHKRFDLSNLQSLCHVHHTEATNREMSAAPKPPEWYDKAAFLRGFQRYTGSVAAPKPTRAR